MPLWPLLGVISHIPIPNCFISKSRGYIWLAVSQELCTIPDDLQLWFSSACCSATEDDVRRSHNFGAAVPDSLEKTLQPQL